MTSRIKKIRNSKIAIYGCGKNFIRKKSFICECLNPMMYVDSNSKIWGQEIYNGIVCSSPREIDNKKIDTIVITPENDIVINQIKGELKNDCEVFTLNEIWEENEIELQKNVDFGCDDEKIRHFACEIGSCSCNLNCSYCYTNFQDSSSKHTSKFPHSVSFMLKALSKERLGGKAFFNMCGQGETLLKPNIIELIYGLLSEGHYVGVITNGTVTSKIKELLSFPREMIERIWFQFSLHYIELQQKKLLDVYFENVNLVRSYGASISTTFPGADEYFDYAQSIKKISIEKCGFLPVVSAIRSEANFSFGFPLGSEKNRNQYIEFWDEFKSGSLKMRSKTWDKYTNVCYAGMNSGWINLSNGEFRSCIPGEKLDNIYDNISNKIKTLDNSHLCKYGYCSHNIMFLSGVHYNGEDLPTWYECFNRVDTNGENTITDCMKKAINYISNY